LRSSVGDGPVRSAPQDGQNLEPSGASEPQRAQIMRHGSEVLGPGATGTEAKAHGDPGMRPEGFAERATAKHRTCSGAA